MRLLVIEDEADSRDMLSMLLETAGYDVTSVAQEEAAVRELLHGGFDLVLADLMLGHVSEDEAWTYLKRVADLARPAPIGLVSGWADASAKARLAGAAFVLRKPCSGDDLFEQLATTLNLAALTRSAQDTLRDYFACIAAGEYHRFRSFLSSDFVYRLPSRDTRYANEVRGIEAFIEFSAKTFEQHAQPAFELQAMRPLPQGAIVEYVGSWNEGNERRQMPGAVMFQMKDGLIVRADVRVNVDELR